MPPAGQPATIPPEFLEHVNRWAQRQPDPVSVILFGSRARGDHGPESDWDIALVFEGECPSLDGLPRALGDRDIDWAPIELSHAMRQLNVCGLPHAVAADGRCLRGDPLPRPERRDMNLRHAWDNLVEAHGEMRRGMDALADYWVLPARLRWGYDTAVARHGAMAGELLCKAVMNMRGMEPRRSHSVAELCDAMQREFPGDPLLPLLRDCDGQTEKAHVNVYAEMEFGREDVDLSARRLAAALRASGDVLAAACDLSFSREGRSGMEHVALRRALICAQMDDLRATDCPRNIRGVIQAGIDAWPDTQELWYLLEAPPLGRTPESAGSGWEPQER